MKNLFVLFFISSLFVASCASYPNYYIKDSTITTQQTTQAYQPAPYYTVNSYGGPTYYVPPVYGGWGWGGWYGNWGGWGCW